MKVKTFLKNMATGLGGLDWDDVHELLKEFAEKVPEVEVRIYE